MMSAEFRLKGVHVLAMMVAFFAVIIAVNMVFLTFAVRSFPGEHEEKSYMQGLNYNDRLAARERQEALGWVVEIDEARLQGTDATIVLAFKSNSGEPIFDLDVAATLERAVDDDADIQLAFERMQPGAYRAVAANAGPGQWRLKGNAIDQREATFEFETTLILE